MKKNILLLAAIASSLCSFAQREGYRVSGTVKGAHDGDTVKIETFEGFSSTTLACAVVKNGRYVFTGRQDAPTMRYLTCATRGKNIGFAQFVLENGDITVNLDSASYSYDIKGTATNEAWCKYHNDNERMCGVTLDLFRALQDSTLAKDIREAKQKELAAKEAELTAYRLKFSRQNIKNVAGAYTLCVNARDFNADEVAALVAQIPDDITEPAVVSLKQEIINKRKTALGEAYTDFTMDTPEGKKMSVSDVVKTAKVTMIDFWASWCGPCRAEMPNVKAAYEKYHSKGFEIIGVSLDNDKEAWLKAIKTLGLEWPQVSDLKGWKCEGSELYGVKAIPATVLIVDGKIVARNVRGEAIEKKLAELLDR